MDNVHMDESFVKAEESTKRRKGKNCGKKVAEQVELKEPTLVKEGVDEVNVRAVDAEKSRER
ncbi:unnamed protein product [Thlaspi arvense]|uniref:Uncharacterized protein n=1 Tax=Thlaspi arvense TaxID=13288 RepID=A0AAU9RYX3_THLAR|nr:unnamed protein product [Thlaspi arvense]